MAQPDELFGIYVKTFGKMKSGTKIVNSDYYHPGPTCSLRSTTR